MKKETEPTVGILMCTLNGMKYLNDQLYSIANQNYSNWHLFVSDEGSTDRTLEILKSFAKIYGEHKVTIFKGPRQGATQNFLSLVRATHKHCEYFAFSDQDDIWYKDKLIVAVGSLAHVEPSVPALYCSSTQYISEFGQCLQMSYIFKREVNFKNALVQSIAGGNTMVFNQTAASILARTSVYANLVAHDWWIYILVSGHGGWIYYDQKPSIEYRQHSEALVGENRSIKAKFIRIRKLLNGSYRQWNAENLKALDDFRQELTPENQKTLDWFEKMKSKFILLRINAYIFSGLRRQTFIGNVALFIGVLLNKV